MDEFMMMPGKMAEFLTTELLKIKIGIAVCFVLLLIIAAVYFVEKMKGENK